MQLGTHDNRQSARPGPAHSGRTIAAVTALVCALLALTVSTPIGAAPLSPVVPLELGAGAEVEAAAPMVVGKQVLRPFAKTEPAKTEPAKQVEPLSTAAPTAESVDADDDVAETPSAPTPPEPTSDPVPTAAPESAPVRTADATPDAAPVAAPAPTAVPATLPASTVPPTTAAPAPAGAQLDTGAEGAMIGSVNSMRANAGLPGLATNGDLTARARSWAKSMADTSNLAHSGMINGLLGAWNTAGENVGYGGSSSSIMGAFAGSSGHYANIVNANFTHIGVGTYVDDSGTLWTTHLFAG